MCQGVALSGLSLAGYSEQAEQVPLLKATAMCSVIWEKNLVFGHIKFTCNLYVTVSDNAFSDEHISGISSKTDVCAQM